MTNAGKHLDKRCNDPKDRKEFLSHVKCLLPKEKMEPFQKNCDFFGVSIDLENSLSPKLGLELVEKRAYYMSNYFSFCAPLYFVWRVYIVLAAQIAGEAAAETFSLAFIKK